MELVENFNCTLDEHCLFSKEMGKLEEKMDSALKALLAERCGSEERLLLLKDSSRIVLEECKELKMECELLGEKALGLEAQREKAK